MDLQGREETPLYHYTDDHSEEMLQAISQSLPHLVWMADEQGHIYWWNHKWTEYTGKSQADLRSEGWFKTVHPHHLERVQQGLQESFQNQTDWEDTFPVGSEGGQWRWFLSRAVPIRNRHGDVTGWIGTLTDINDRRKLEESLRKGQAIAESSHKTKADLLVNMSREIRTPLNTILGFASLLKESNLSDEDRAQFAERILSNGDLLLQIIDDILNLSKFELETKSQEKIRFNFCDLIYDIIQTMKPVAEKKDIKVNVFFNSAIPKLISSDPHRLRQIFSNLLANAIKYTDNGGRIMVFLGYQENTKGGPAITLDIEDTGIGISPEQQKKIFHPFAQLEGAFGRNGSGRKLGLALSEKLAESLGGSLTLRGSEIGQGSCFTLTVPTGDLQGIEFIKGKKGEPITRKFLNSLRRTKRLDNVKVLLAEDSEDNETLVKLYLEKEGAQITYAHNGLEVLDFVKSQSFDVILMDIQMPLLDGLEATRQLRQNGFQKPILALTAHALEGDAEKSLKAGCDTHLTKPIRGEVLIEEIQKRVFH